MPRIVAGGGRSDTFKLFAKALGHPDTTAILLVDSETPITQGPWKHLQIQDGWEPPDAISNDQVQFMATCMETWIVADRDALRKFFGPCLQENALPPLQFLEHHPKQDVQNALKQATRDCEGKSYQKGALSFQLLTRLDSTTLSQHLAYFRRLVETLDKYLV